MLCFYITVLILGLISDVYMDTCPTAKEIYPCTCRKSNDNRDLMVQCDSDNDSEETLSLELLQKALKGLVGKNYVDLSLYHIQDPLPSKVFSGIGIITLSFYFCRLDNLTKDDQPGLLGLEDRLEVLRISGSSTVQTKLNLGHLKKLRDLSLDFSDISELGDDWLSKAPPSLEYLHIEENNIIKIGNNTFSRLKKLEYLALEGNRFGPIQRNMLPTAADRLLTLNLGNNGLTDLPLDLFSKMPSITDVLLYENGIRTIDERTWSPIWQQLDRLELTENKIICDDRLNWIFKSKKRPRIYGECTAPIELKGKDLEAYFESRSQEQFTDD